MSEATLAAHRHTTSGLLGWASRTWDEYQAGDQQAGDDRPLPGYLLLSGTYASLCAVTAAAVARKARRDGALEPPRLRDLAVTAVAVFRMSRTLAKDAVLSPLRAPFVVFDKPGGPDELVEAPRPGPVRHAVGELVVCPFCLGQWVATAAVAGHLLMPRTTRWLTGGLAVVAVSDALQLVYDKGQQKAT
jgi:hypothetical protein